MARLSVLYLPKSESADDHPFALVLSDCDTVEAEDLNKIGIKAFKEDCGARGVLIAGFPIEVE